VPYRPRQDFNLERTPQIPLARASERDDQLVHAWLKKDWQRIKKLMSAQAGHRFSR
jgi:hypothetical protein